MLDQLREAEDALHSKIEGLELRKAAKRDADSAAAAANQAASDAADEESHAYAEAQAAALTVKSLIEQLTTRPAA